MAAGWDCRGGKRKCGVIDSYDGSDKALLVLDHYQGAISSLPKKKKKKTLLKFSWRIARSHSPPSRAMPQAPPAPASSEREPDTARSSSGAEASTSSIPPNASSSTFTISPVGATAVGVAVAAAACALAAGGHWRATASALAEEGIDAVTRRKAVPTAVRFVSVSSICPLCFLAARFGFSRPPSLSLSLSFS